MKQILTYFVNTVASSDGAFKLNTKLLILFVPLTKAYCIVFSADKEVGAIEQAHDSIVWTLAWHPLGHILCSGSNDHTSKFWTRNRPGDLMRDKYNLNTLPAGISGLEEVDIGSGANPEESISIIPGMGPEDKVDLPLTSDGEMAIPGLDLDLFAAGGDDKSKAKKVPYSKPIPRNFQAQWNETAAAGLYFVIFLIDVLE